MAKYSTGSIKAALAITKALADENRLRALMFLRGGQLCVCQIVAALKLAPSTVSKHLAILQQAGLVESRKEGRWMYYRLAEEDDCPPAVAEGLRWVRQTLKYDPQVRQDRQMVNTVRKASKKVLCRCYKG
jgi:ArsR family transcriptional regulator, arsenate/arsenite/antimonite-responsive transcriptional repressor